MVFLHYMDDFYDTLMTTSENKMTWFFSIIWMTSMTH